VSSPTAHPLTDAVTVPQGKNAVWIERLIWVFMMSFAFDYRGDETQGGSGGGIAQLLFLALCLGSSAGLLLLGWRNLLVRPGAKILIFWGLFVGFMLVNSFLQGVPFGRSSRVVLPLILCLCGMINAHIAGCAGISPGRIVNPMLTAACINVIWRIIHGFAFKGLDVATVRFEILSPINDWLAAWIACAILLRGKFHWNLLVACAVLFIGIFITITRSLIFPIFTAGMVTSICFMLGIRWGIYQWSALGKRLLPLAAAGVLIISALGLAALFQPLMLERWTERMFHDADSRNMANDVSYLTRKAEADAMWKILAEDPIHFIHGRGVGSSYHWDSAYLPEISMVMPLKDLQTDGIWFAGHSIWTYGLLSGGTIAILSYLILLISTCVSSIRAAHANASDPGPDQWLAFLPCVATFCLVSLSITANPFQERLVGIFYGMMVGLSQAFMVRASWIHTTAKK